MTVADAELTDRQREVLGLIGEAVARDGYPPTTRDLAEGLGVKSTNGVVGHLAALQRAGLVALDPHTSRGIRVLVPMPLPAADVTHDGGRVVLRVGAFAWEMDAEQAGQLAAALAGQLKGGDQ